MDREDLRNWVVFAVLAFGILGFYQVFVYGPQEAQRRAAVRAESAAQVQVHGGATPTAPSAFIPRAQAEAAVRDQGPYARTPARSCSAARRSTTSI